MCEELIFCHILEDPNPSWDDETRRWSIHMHSITSKDLDTIRSTKSRIRSVFLFSVSDLPMTQLLGTLAVTFKLLKVLDLHDTPLDQLHEEVGNLLHLRYLSINTTNVKTIPKSIGNLHNLQTLNLKFSLVCVLQIGIVSRLHKLRHLIAFSRDLERGVKIQGGIGHLQELHTLWGVEDLDSIKELENLRQLRKLGILNLKRESGKDLCKAIEKMKHLQWLDVWAMPDEILDLHSLSSSPESLQRLSMIGSSETLPSWIPKLDNLISLRLQLSGLICTHTIKALQALPNLIELKFYDGDGEQLYFEVGGFQKLKLLHLGSFKELKSIVIEEGGLPVLNKLLIEDCRKLKEVPFGIHNLRELKSLHCLSMPTKFLDRMEPDNGEDYWAVEHIPDVRFRRLRRTISRSLS